MHGESQPGEPDKLDKALFALKAVWFGLFAGAVVITAAAVAVVTSNEEPMADLGELGYVFLLAVPVGLFGAFVVAPMAGSKNPGDVVRSAGPRGTSMYPGWEGTRPDDPYYWFPAYATVFFVRAGMLEACAIPCAIGFLITSNWAVLGGALVLIAALVVQIPTRAAVETFAENARRRQANAG